MTRCSPSVYFGLYLANLFVSMALAPVILAETSPSSDYKQKLEDNFSDSEKLMNFGYVYGAQWLIYYGSQGETIRDKGSFQNWHENMTKPHFDKDHFNYNLIKHTGVGQYYYQFYRSRGYTQKDSFQWAALSSLAFEFTIETVTERPSYQDIYQTPVFGSIVGMGFERVSLYMHSLETWPTTIIGYLFDPFTALPSSHYQLGLYPIKQNDKAALTLTFKADL